MISYSKDAAVLGPCRKIFAGYLAKLNALDDRGLEFKKGEILAMENGKLAFVEKDINKALVKLVRNLTKKVEDGFCMTLIYGEDVTEEQANAAYSQLQNKFGDYEISLVKGDQPVYYYILAVE